MTDTDDAPEPDLTDRQRQFIGNLPASSPQLADALAVAESTIEGYRNRLREKGVPLEYNREQNQWYIDGSPGWMAAATEDTESGDGVAGDTDGANTDKPSADDLTDREAYLVRELQTGATLEELADDLDERPAVIETHLSEIEAQGWSVYHDDEADLYEIEGDHTLRSSEHKGTRTRKANRWWEVRNNALERQWKRLVPTEIPAIAADGHEDWVTHLTDLHAGDVVRDYSGDIVYETADIPTVVEYITQQSIGLSEKHNATYDCAHLLYGGDLVTNEGIYEGQFEDLDAWLDEQADVIQQALVEQIYTFAEYFDRVNIVCQVGNHGENRASGTTRQNNADLLIYKHLRNFITKVQRHEGGLQNVSIKVGEARAYTPVALRGGQLHGQLRHGQHRKPQAETSARLKEWLSTLLDTINSSWGAFDVAWMGHHHVSGRIPWNGPPILVSGSPKPGGEYIEQLGTKGQAVDPQQIAHCHGVSDEGVTSMWPIDTRHYSR